VDKIIVVVYKKPKGRKHYLTVFEGITVEDVIDKKKRKPPLPHDYELVEVGWGEYFIESYMKQYNIKSVTQK
jgi:hypothetical protein